MKFGNYEILSSFCLNVLLKFLLAKGAKNASNSAAYLGTWLTYYLTYIIIVPYLQTLLLLIHFQPLYLIHIIYTQRLCHRVPEHGIFTAYKSCIC
jgi:uncharacterized MAPEG superfamily protein